MKFYWTLKSVPELSDLSADNRRKVWRIAYRESGGLSHGELISLGLAVAVGVRFGPLGVGLCVAVAMLPIMSRMVKRFRPSVLTVRERLGLGSPPVPEKISLLSVQPSRAVTSKNKNLLKFIRAIVLFPIRLTVAVLATAYFLASWGPTYSFPGRPPIFGGEHDRFVFALKRLGARRYGLIQYDLERRSSEILFECRMPIHEFGFRHASELEVCSYVKGAWIYRVINLREPKREPTIFPKLPGFLNTDRLMPKTIGFISTKVECSEDTCWTQFYTTTPDGIFALGQSIPGPLYSGPCLSQDEDLLAYADEEQIVVRNLRTHNEAAFPFGQSLVCNWSNNQVLLACSRKSMGLVLIHGLNQEARLIAIPEAQCLIGGVLSPSGKYVAYWTANAELGEAQPVILSLFSVVENKHYRLARRGMILGVRWSPGERYLSVVGIKRRDLFDIGYALAMPNAYTHDKAIIKLDGVGRMLEILEESDWIASPQW